MRLQLLIGPISSGKSTFCKSAAEKGAIIVNDDAIVTAIHGGNYKLYDKTLKPLYKIIENTVIQTGLIMGRTVIVDRPNYSKSMRSRYISIAKSLDVPVDAIIMEHFTSEIHAKRRMESDSRGYDYEYWLKVANHHKSLAEEPDLSEGFDKIINWRINEK